MKKINLILSLLLVSHTSFAYLPASAVTSQKLKLYALYTTADASCQTGLVATVPMVSTPVVLDLVTGPQVSGSANVSSSVNCIIAVVANSSTVAVSTNSSNFTGSSTFGAWSGADSLCTGVFASPLTGSVVNQTGLTITWPTQISTDLATNHLTGATVTSSSQTDIIPIYVSTNSKCTAQYASDKNITGCTAYTGTVPTTNPHAMPTVAASTSLGINLATTIASGAPNGYKMVFNPANTIGGGNGGCVSGYPLVSFTSR